MATELEETAVKHSSKHSTKRRASRQRKLDQQQVLDQTGPASLPSGSTVRPTVAIVGAGRLGTALARALAARGYTIAAVVARRLAQARHAAALTDAHTLALAHTQLDRLPTSDLIFITTPDDALREVSAQLAAHLPATHRPRVVLHASGALSSTELEAMRALGSHTGSMHPLVSISEPVSGAQRLSEAFYCVEGDRVAVREARAIVRDLGGQSFSIKAQHKALYHAAAVMASGHLVALLDIAVEMLKACGVKERSARHILTPLVRSTLSNLSESEPARALTGTFARADITTVRRHLKALESSQLPEALAAYILLGQRSLRLAQQRGADISALKEIANALRKATRHESKK